LCGIHSITTRWLLIIVVNKMKKEIKDLDLGRFSERIYKSKLIPNSDGTFDYDGYLDFVNMDLKSLEEIPIKLRRVNDSFMCSRNKITNLEGSPLVVGGHFWCSYNKLTSLQGAPLKVGGHFWCSFNNLISLQYAPSYIGSDFGFYINPLLSEECLSVIKGNFETRINPFKITDDVIDSIKQMTYEQQMDELKFFDEHDLNASKMFQEILNDLGVEYGSEKRKSIIKISKGLNLKHLGI